MFQGILKSLRIWWSHGGNGGALMVIKDKLWCWAQSELTRIRFHCITLLALSRPFTGIIITKTRCAPWMKKHNNLSIGTLCYIIYQVWRFERRSFIRMKHVSLWQRASIFRRANAWNVRLYYPYRQDTNLFIFRFVSEHFLRSMHYIYIIIIILLYSTVPFHSCVLTVGTSRTRGTVRCISNTWKRIDQSIIVLQLRYHNLLRSVLMLWNISGRQVIDEFNPQR